MVPCHFSCHVFISLPQYSPSALFLSTPFTITFSTHTFWHRWNISFPTLMLKNSCSQETKLTEGTQYMAILIALGICQWPWQKSKEGRPKCLEERLLGPKLEINLDQWHSGGHEVYVFSQGRDRHHQGDTGGQEALQSQGRKGHRRGTGGVTIRPRGKVLGSGCWAPFRLPQWILRVSFPNTNEKLPLQNCGYN